MKNTVTEFPPVFRRSTYRTWWGRYYENHTIQAYFNGEPYYINLTTTGWTIDSARRKMEIEKAKYE